MGWNYLSIPKLQRRNRWSLGMDNEFHTTIYNECNYLFMLGLKLIHDYQWHHDMTMISIGSVDYPQKDQWCTHSIFHFSLAWKRVRTKSPVGRDVKHHGASVTSQWWKTYKQTYSILCRIHCNDSIWAVWLLIHRQLNCVFNILFSLTQKIKSPRLLALCEWNSPMIGGFPSQRTSKAERGSKPRRQHVCTRLCFRVIF